MGHYGGSYKVTYGLYKKYGDMRVMDTPICGELDNSWSVTWERADVSIQWAGGPLSTLPPSHPQRMASWVWALARR